MSGTYKNFGKSFYKVLANVFYNYTTILIFLFGKKAQDLHSALAKLYSNVYKLSTIYKWQEAVFLIVIKAYTFIVVQQPTDIVR